MDKEEKGIPKENREGKGFPVIPCPCPPYRAAPYMAIYARMHAPLLLPWGPCMPPSMAMYARMHAPLLLPWGPCMPPYMAMYARMHAPLLLPWGPCMPPYMAMYARMHAPLSGTKIRTIRKAVKRQALYLIWTSAVIGHVLEQ
jgi:hypothetical protein